MGDQEVQQMQQPVVVYPNTYTKQYPYPSSSSGSDGSFGTVVIVLAVIFLLAALVCILERLCNRVAKKNKHLQHQNHEKAFSYKNREIRPVEREPRERGEYFEFEFDMKRSDPRPMEREVRERGDLDFGFNMKQSELKEKPSRRDGEDVEFGERGRGGQPPPSIKRGVRFKLPENEDYHPNGEFRHGGPGFEFRPEL